jgi:hypothetical protein
MLTALLESLFGCSHRRRSWPQTPVNRKTGWCGEPYSVCLDCGKRFDGGLPEIEERPAQVGAEAVLDEIAMRAPHHPEVKQ